MTARRLFQIEFTGRLDRSARERLDTFFGSRVAADSDESDDTAGMARIGKLGYMVLTWEGGDGPRWRVTAATHNPTVGHDDEEARQMLNTLLETLKSIPSVHVLTSFPSPGAGGHGLTESSSPVSLDSSDKIVSPEVRETADIIQTFRAGGLTEDTACERLRRLGVAAAVVEAARALYERRVGIIRDQREPRVVATPEVRIRNWYGGPTALSRYWPEFLGNVLDSLPTADAEDAGKEVDAATSRILDLTGPPGAASIQTRGLVLGYVQSGKTTNFMGLAAKAADAGYRLFVVLSGVTDNLRSQTQARVEQILVGHHPERWHLLTDVDSDFNRRGNAANLLSDLNQRLIAVVKKNPYRLRRLLEWLTSASSEVLKGVPILLIDDEADQASLDVGAKGRTSRINGLIRQILSVPKAAYVAYTATPFANLLINPKDYEGLYPRDFVVELDQPASYFGPDRLFGRERLSDAEPEAVTDGLDVVRIIDSSETRLVAPPPGRGAVYGWEPAVAPSLAEAVDWFLIATAARRARSRVVEDSTMLVHTSMLAEAHHRLKLPLEEYVKGTRDMWAAADAATRTRLEALWSKESERLPASDVGLKSVAWGAVAECIGDVLEKTRVIVDNYTSSDRLIYKRDDPATVIVVGGNTLSRGLTLEGLVSSYFVRSASAYDTLLQMGRWFGYRRGYEDLPRIWTTEELAQWFADVATVEEEIRRQIRSFPPDVTPGQLGIMIRCHPSMTITSAAKMRDAIDAAISFSQQREQTILFNHKDSGWLQHNISAAKRLVETARQVGNLEDNLSRGRTVVKGVPASAILAFLDEYRMHPRAFRLRPDLLKGYIQNQVRQGYLQSWNIVLFENPRRSAVNLDIGFDRGIRTIERSRLKKYEAYANIKALVSTIDRVADLGLGPAEVRAAGADPTDDSSLARYREDIVGNVGMLGLYPIDKDSQPGDPSTPGQRETRVALDAENHVIGVALYFPKARGEDSLQYKTADLSYEPVEDVADEVNAADLADEQAAATEVPKDA